ncbi:MAG: mechanosensitive ion channel family protein [Clostridia bacterium]|nr:mechanosensitive ion channel family protein [Clostridia bacterium]
MTNFFQETLGINLIEVTKMIIPILVTFLVCRIAISVILKVLKKVLDRSKLDKGITSFSLGLAKVIMYFMVVLIIADMLSIPVSSLLATFSIVGVAASLAIQDALGNLASGAMILATKPFKVGDYVDCVATNGTVKQITFSHTVFATPDNKIIRVPNSQILNSVITNFSETDKRRVDWTFKIANRKDEERARQLISAVVEKNTLILDDPEVFLRPTVFDDSGIVFTLRVWVKSGDYWTVYHDVLEEVNHLLDANGIEIPSNKLDIRVVEKR